MGFPSQEYWSGLPFPSPGDLPHPGIKPESPILAGGFSTTEPPGSPMSKLHSLGTAANAEICRHSAKHKMQQRCLPSAWASWVTENADQLSEVSHTKWAKETSRAVQWLRTCLPVQATQPDHWSWKTPHAAGQLGPRATTTEHTRLEPVLHDKRSHHSEKPVCGSEDPVQPKMS